VDLARAWAPGQAYVAVSRATSVRGLQILNFQPSKVVASPLALDLDAACTSTESLAEFVNSVPTWWHAIVNHSCEEWALLYMQDPTFRKWETDWPQTAASTGHKRKRDTVASLAHQERVASAEAADRDPRVCEIREQIKRLTE
jgi:hypothetical protein